MRGSIVTGLVVLVAPAAFLLGRYGPGAPSEPPSPAHASTPSSRPSDDGAKDVVAGEEPARTPPSTRPTVAPAHSADRLRVRAYLGLLERAAVMERLRLVGGTRAVGGAREPEPDPASPHPAPTSMDWPEAPDMRVLQRVRELVDDGHRLVTRGLTDEAELRFLAALELDPTDQGAQEGMRRVERRRAGR